MYKGRKSKECDLLQSEKHEFILNCLKYIKRGNIRHIFGFYLNTFSMKYKNNIHKEIQSYCATKVKLGDLNLFGCNHKKYFLLYLTSVDVYAVCLYLKHLLHAKNI